MEGSAQEPNSSMTSDSVLFNDKGRVSTLDGWILAVCHFIAKIRDTSRNCVLFEVTPTESRVSQFAVTWETSPLALQVKHSTLCLALGNHSDHAHVERWLKVWVQESDKLHLNPALSGICCTILDKLFKLSKPQIPLLKVRK